MDGGDGQNGNQWMVEMGKMATCGSMMAKAGETTAYIH
jgi:hypothetical protein